MAVIRAQVVHEHTSGIPRDNAVNTFHFNGPTDETTLTAIYTALTNFFYVEYAAGGGAFRAVDSFLSTFYNAHRVKLYDVTDEPSGPPLLDLRTTLVRARNGNFNLPSEVAVCLSFEGTPEAGLVQERRRGRIYIGALNTSANGGGTNALARPAAIMTETLRNAAVALAAEVDDVAEWVVYSRPFAGRGATDKRRADGTYYPALAARPGTTVNVDRVWVDDAFDTQRRRGDKPTGRGPIVATA